jgi:hypothetical protein
MENYELIFHEEMLGIYEKAKKECGYNATRFLQMVQEKGGLKAAKQWLSTDTPQEGLFKLWELSRLDLSMERLVLRKQFRKLFTDQELAIARKRLHNLHYSIDEDC